MDSVGDLVKRLKAHNDAYRRGEPQISDREYDRLVEVLRERDPANPFLHAVEPETFEARREIRHPNPMLSIDKAYTREALVRFLKRTRKAADEMGADNVSFIVTPKLDGLAGRDDGDVFASRGNGEVGYEISSAYDKGVVPLGGRGQGLGEIVIEQSYFDTHLSNEFEHPRNMVVGIVSSDSLNDSALRALQDKRVHFVPYSQLPSWTGYAEALLADLDGIMRDLSDQTDYPMDGIVIAVASEQLRSVMGATANHYRWQIAFKTKGETAHSVVEEVIWQVGRTGNVTPVLVIRPVSISGATIRRVTGHHAGLVKKHSIGTGAEIRVIRSGEVIPKLEEVVSPSSSVRIPGRCPSCDTQLQWERDFLKCHNPDCSAQAVQRISHWFKTLGNADWFGLKTIEKLVDHGYDSLEKVYRLGPGNFEDLGFGPVQSRNLADALEMSRTKPVADWRFLAAFGIPDLGKADSRSLLSHIRLDELPNATAEDISRIDGFGPVTSTGIAGGLAAFRQAMQHMGDIGFNLETTPLHPPTSKAGGRLAGKRLVFTGRMARGSREAMQSEARRQGAVIQTSIGGKTDYLVCGEEVGESKLAKARGLGTKVLSEADYYGMLESDRGEPS